MRETKMKPTLTTLLDDIEAKARAATQGEWYAHRGGDCYGPEATVRSGFFRWLKVTEVEPQYQKNVADALDDAKYFARMSPPTTLALVSALRVAREALEDLKSDVFAMGDSCNRGLYEKLVEALTPLDELFEKEKTK